MERMRRQVGRIAVVQADSAATPTASTVGGTKMERNETRGKLQQVNSLHYAHADREDRFQHVTSTASTWTRKPFLTNRDRVGRSAWHQYASSQSFPFSDSLFCHCDTEQDHWCLCPPAVAAYTKRVKRFRAQTSSAIHIHCAFATGRILRRRCRSERSIGLGVRRRAAFGAC